MKKAIKVMAAVMLVAAMVFSIASCGVDMNKVKGDWYVSTINGKSAADFAAESGTVEVMVQKSINITDKELSMSAIGPEGNVLTSKGDVTVRANGVESTIDGVLFGFEFHEADNTLTYSVSDGTNQYDYVLKKGTYDLAGKYAEAVAAAQGTAEEGGEGGEENYGEEDGEYYGEEYAEEGYAE